MRKIAIKSLLTIIVLSLSMFALTTISNAAYAEEKTFEIIEGAQVKVSDNNDDTTGIRFLAKLTKSQFDEIVSGNDAPVYFGIELSANGKANDICYLVDDKTKDPSVNNEVTFIDNVCSYSATITYTVETLTKEMALNSKFNVNYDSGKTDAENIQSFDSEVLNSYLRKAYETVITAKPFYKIGEGEKVYGTGSTSRSILGVATYAYAQDSTTYADLALKYFTPAGSAVNANGLIETGKILDYTLGEKDKVFYETSELNIVNGNLPSELTSTFTEGQVVSFNVVDDLGNYKVLNITFKSSIKTISAQAYYDSAADKMYYKEGNVQKTLAGNSTSTFSYVADETNSYPLATYNDSVMTSNVNYKYADSVLFDDNKVYDKDNNRSYGSMLKALQPKIKTDSNPITVVIPYASHLDQYTGVKTLINVDGIDYVFTDTVIISAMIDDSTEFDNIFNNPDQNAVAPNSYALRYAYVTKYGTITKGVYMLANNIDCSTGFTYDNSWWNYFEGVLDGRGYNIENMDVSGTEANPGNGIFSATSPWTAIQNIGFINVTANYGSVFQGNMYDYVSNVQKIIPTYYLMHDTSGDGGNKLGSIYYRSQLVDDSDTTTTIGELLKYGTRGASYAYYGNGVEEYTFGGYFSNVYVQINPNTKRLMGTISRNMANMPNTVRAYNMVIEYLPTQLYDSTEGANDGALPYGYDYCNGLYGSLFGGAYEKKATGAQFDNQYNDDSYTFKKDGEGNYKNLVFYEPNTSLTGGNCVQTQGALNFHFVSKYNGGRINQVTKLYVISPVGLVSSAKGSILGTNETATDNNPYKFEGMMSYLWNADATSRLDRFDDYEHATIAEKTKWEYITSYVGAIASAKVYWTDSTDGYAGGYLVWRNKAK